MENVNTSELFEQQKLDRLKKEALEEFTQCKSQEIHTKIDYRREDIAKILISKQMEGYDYYHANLEKISLEYNGKWIGIKDDRILFPSDKCLDLLGKLDDHNYKDVYVIQVGVKPKTYELGSN